MGKGRRLPIELRLVSAQLLAAAEDLKEAQRLFRQVEELLKDAGEEEAQRYAGCAEGGTMIGGTNSALWDTLVYVKTIWVMKWSKA